MSRRAVLSARAGSSCFWQERAEFAVHAWADEDGREPGDYAVDAPENRAYLDYYQEMGMTALEAAKFYAMTNSAANADAKWLGAEAMGKWVRLD